MTATPATRRLAIDAMRERFPPASMAMFFDAANPLRPQVGRYLDRFLAKGCTAEEAAVQTYLRMTGIDCPARADV